MVVSVVVVYVVVNRVDPAGTSLAPPIDLPTDYLLTVFRSRLSRTTRIPLMWIEKKLLTTPKQLAYTQYTNYSASRNHTDGWIEIVIKNVIRLST